MQSRLGILEHELLSRNALIQHSTDYVQREGWTIKYRWDPNRPASGGWVGRPLMAISIPLTVNGRRIAVIDEQSGTIDALVVGKYVGSNNDEAAVASPNSYAVKWDIYSRQIVAGQVDGLYAVKLGGRKVVGITKGEMTLLRSMATHKL